jgi:hypothetical protein
MDEVKSIADNDKWKLVREFCLLQEVLDFLRVIKIALPANTLDFPNLTSASSGLDIFEVDLWILAEVDDGSKVIVKTCSAL